MKAARQAELKERHEEIAETLKAQVAVEKSRELKSKPLNEFHLQIMSLWKHDTTFQLNDSDLKKQSVFATAMVQEALFGDIPEPKTIDMLYRSATRSEWLDSIAQEWRTLEERGTWVLVPREKFDRR